jgi:hypothetical protein
MKRRLVPALFLVFYTASVVGLTIDRTQTWVAEHARDFKHDRSLNGARIGESHRRSPRQLHTRLIEDGPVLVSPFVRTSDPPNSETALHHLLSGFVAGQSARVISSRAPPTSVF